MTRFLLQDTTTGAFFASADAPHAWTGNRDNAHTWVDLDRAASAAKVAIEVWSMAVSVVERR